VQSSRGRSEGRAFAARPEGGVAVVVGVQVPRVTSVPPFASSRGAEAVEVARSAGLILDLWQQHVLMNALGVREDGSWAAFEVGLDVARQNGKGGVLEGRKLAGLFVFEEPLIIYSAHHFSTASEAFRRLLMLIESTPELDRQVKRVTRKPGESEIETKKGCRCQYRTRTKGGGRGFSGSTVLFDEAMFLPEFELGAILPIVSAQPNPQIWFAGSAVDQQIHSDGVVWARVRERGHAGKDPRLAYFEWSADAVSPSELDDEQASDRAGWAQANPGLGIRISPEHVENEQRTMDPRTFAVERLGVGDWPATDGTAGSVIPLEDWLALADASSSIEGSLVFGFDVSPDRAWASIAVAGRRADGLTHVEIVEHRRGTAWLPARLAELCEKHDPDEVVRDPMGPAGSIVVPVDVRDVTAREHANGCGLFYDMVAEKTLRHLGTPELQAAVKGGVKRPLGDAWAWSRKNSQVNISPLVAATLALFCVSLDDGSADYVLDTRRAVAA
jgi:hypothetical protein